MGYKLVEVHLPGSNFDKLNKLPSEYGGVLEALSRAGLKPESTIIVTYSHQERDELTSIAEREGVFDVTYTGTYGDLPPENLDHFLAGSDTSWDFIIAGRYWRACHYVSFAHLLREIKVRNPKHVNFHFIKSFIDGLNHREVADLVEGKGTYTNDAFHVGGLIRVLEDGIVKHVRVKNEDFKHDQQTGKLNFVPGLPDTMTTIDICFWSDLHVMLSSIRKE